MSLLIKALHKAEQSKNEVAQNAAVGTPPVVGDHKLELAPHDDAGSSLRDEIGFEPSPAPVQAQRQTASTVLLAGRRSVGGGQAPRALWLAGAGLLFLLLLGGGFYYYLDSLEPPALVVARPVVPMLPAPMPEPSAPAATPAPMPPVMADEPQVNAPSVAASEVPPREEKPAAVRVPPAQPEAPVASAEEKPKPRPGNEPAPRVVRNRPPAVVISDDVAAGYRAYTAGDDGAAGRHYLAAAQADPRNVDAWLGLAAVAARQGKASDAANHYLRALELEPRNAAAQTGLISLSGQSDPMASESRLKNLLAQQPEAAFLHAALGSLYADQGQWTAAQQAYFQAFRFDAGNPEHAFNLAVSLDQMGKAELALTHYQKALDLLAMHGGRLDRPQLEARIAQLRQSLSPSQ